MFWGDTTLQARLVELIVPYDPNRIERASYRLSVGKEVYVSPTGTKADPPNKPITLLPPKEGFTIPPGQFGFILTEESVSVPKDAIALISIRAKYKFRGLVNVSGFHIDPGYEGRLIFSVFNSGPSAVHLRRGEECFLVWYAALDSPTSALKKEGHDEIPSILTGPLAQGLESFSRLRTDIENLKFRLRLIVTIGSAIIPVALLGMALLNWSPSEGAPRTPPVTPHTWESFWIP